MLKGIAECLAFEFAEVFDQKNEPFLNLQDIKDAFSCRTDLIVLILGDFQEMVIAQEVAFKSVSHGVCTVNFLRAISVRLCLVLRSGNKNSRYFARRDYTSGWHAMVI